MCCWYCVEKFTAWRWWRHLSRRGCGIYAINFRSSPTAGFSRSRWSQSEMLHQGSEPCSAHPDEGRRSHRNCPHLWSILCSIPSRSYGCSLGFLPILWPRRRRHFRSCTGSKEPRSWTPNRQRHSWWSKLCPWASRSSTPGALTPTTARSWISPFLDYSTGYSRSCTWGAGICEGPRRRCCRRRASRRPWCCRSTVASSNRCPPSPRGTLDPWSSSGCTCSSPPIRWTVHTEIWFAGWGPDRAVPSIPSPGVCVDRPWAPWQIGSLAESLWVPWFAPSFAPEVTYLSTGEIW